MSSELGYENVLPAEASDLMGSGAVCVLDVRTPSEYRDLGHIPGSLLLPVDWVAAAAATLSRDGKPVLVCCEHGIRSAHAAGFLARAGFEGVRNLVGGMAAWTGPRAFGEGSPFHPLGPAAWVIQNADLLTRGAEVLDIACGSGRNALLLAAAGFPVVAVDLAPPRITELRGLAERLGLPLEARIVDLEVPDPSLGSARFDVILGINYLHRPLFPHLVAALRPGGILIYETFTQAQAQHGHPTNPDYLLQPGELPRLVAPLRVERSREGEHEDRHVAGVVARRES